MIQTCFGDTLVAQQALQERVNPHFGTEGHILLNLEVKCAVFAKAFSRGAADSVSVIRRFG